MSIPISTPPSLTQALISDNRDFTLQLVALFDNNAPPFKIKEFLDSHKSFLLRQHRELTTESALLIAVGRGRLEIARYLIENIGVEVNTSDREGMTPLHYAAASGREEMVSLLLEKGAKPNFSSTEAGPEDPLFLAVEKGHEKVVQLLLQKGANPNISRSLCRETPLLEALIRGRSNIACLLIEQGADPNSENIFGLTPLKSAAEQGNTTLIALLISKGADVNKLDMRKQESALVSAVRKGQEEAARLLIKKGALATWRHPVEKTTLLHMITTHSSPSLINFLIEQGADPLLEDRKGTSPLVVAALCGNLPLLKACVRKRANLLGRDREGYTVLDHAAARGHLEIVKHLMGQPGCDPLATTGPDNSTSLHRALRGGHAPIVQYIVEQKPKTALECLDKDGNTPLLLAALCDYAAIFSFLLDKKANLKVANYKGETVHSLVASGKQPNVHAFLIARTLLKEDAVEKQAQSKSKAPSPLIHSDEPLPPHSPPSTSTSTSSSFSSLPAAPPLAPAHETFTHFLHSCEINLLHSVKADTVSQTFYQNQAYHLALLRRAFVAYQKCVEEGNLDLLGIFPVVFSLHEHLVLEQMLKAKKCEEDHKHFDDQIATEHDLAKLEKSPDAHLLSLQLGTLWMRYPYYAASAKSSPPARVRSALSPDVSQAAEWIASLIETIRHLAPSATPFPKEITTETLIPSLATATPKPLPVLPLSWRTQKERLQKRLDDPSLSLEARQSLQNALFHLDQFFLSYRLYTTFNDPFLLPLHANNLIWNMQFFCEQYFHSLNPKEERCHSWKEMAERVGMNRELICAIHIGLTTHYPYEKLSASLYAEGQRLLLATYEDPLCNEGWQRVKSSSSSSTTAAAKVERRSPESHRSQLETLAQTFIDEIAKLS